MNNDFNEKYLKKTEKEEIIFKQKSPLLYKKKASREVLSQETPTTLPPVKLPSSSALKSNEDRISQLVKEIEAKKKVIEEAMAYKTKLRSKIADLQESLIHKGEIVKEIEESIASFEAENKQLKEQIEAKANEPTPNRNGRRRVRELENNLMNILMNIHRIRQSQEESHYPNPDNMTYEELLELEEKMGSVSKGLPSEIINKIPMKPYSSKSYKNDKCIICQFEFKTEQVKVLPCNHCFHKECLDEWLKNEKKCPICKNEVMAK